MDFSWGVNSSQFISQWLLYIVKMENLLTHQNYSHLSEVKASLYFLKNSIPHTVVNGCVCFYLTVAIPYCIYELLSFLWFKKNI